MKTKKQAIVECVGSWAMLQYFPAERDARTAIMRIIDAMATTTDQVDWLAAEMRQYGVKPEVEAFDLSHILKAKEMQQKGQLAGTPYVQFVMGVKNAMPADRDVFDYYIHTVERLFGKDAPWCAAGIGPAQIVLNEWSVSSGGHARTGLEDNVRLDRDTLAPSNAALVRRVVNLCEKYERPVADWRQARQILGLAAPN